MAIKPDLPTPGLAEFSSDTVTALAELFFGDTPAPVTEAYSYSAALALSGVKARTPVYVNAATGEIELVDGTTNTKANAITVTALKAGTPAVTGGLPVYRAGNFNMEALNWPTQFATDLQRKNAFDMGECQIYVNKPYYA